MHMHINDIDTPAGGIVRLNEVGLNYSCFATDDPVEFIGILEFDGDGNKEKFLKSAAFAAYRDQVGRTFANPPATTTINLVASTRG